MVTGGLAERSPWPCGCFVHQGTCAVVESHARAVTNVLLALAYLKATCARTLTCLALTFPLPPRCTRTSA